MRITYSILIHPPPAPKPSLPVMASLRFSLSRDDVEACLLCPLGQQAGLWRALGQDALQPNLWWAANPVDFYAQARGRILIHLGGHARISEQRWLDQLHSRLQGDFGFASSPDPTLCWAIRRDLLEDLPSSDEATESVPSSRQVAGQAVRAGFKIYRGDLGIGG
jgi:hypothetical protein